MNVETIPGARPPLATFARDPIALNASSALAPWSCMRTFTKSIGCVTAPEAMAPREPLAKPFHAAAGRGAAASALILS